MKQICFFILLYSSLSLARKPAVIPITGLSIDEYSTTKNDKGYNWNKNEILATTETTDFPYWIGLLFLPLASLFLLKKRSEGDFEGDFGDLDKSKNYSENLKDNVAEHDNDDHNFPMAS